MSPAANRPPLRIRPGVSWRLATFIVLLHGITLLVVCALPLGSLSRGALSLVILLSLVHGLAGPVLHRLPWSLREVEWQSDGRWSLTWASGRVSEGRLSSSSYVSPSLVILVFRCGRPLACSLLLTSDCLAPDSLRRLRLRLRLYAAGSAHPHGPEPHS